MEAPISSLSSDKVLRLFLDEIRMAISLYAYTYQTMPTLEEFLAYWKKMSTEDEYQISDATLTCGYAAIMVDHALIYEALNK